MTSDNTPAIVVNRVSKSYGSVKALDNMSLNVRRGEIFGLIGPDGAGKTTLFKILVTLLNADEGSAQVDGLDVSNDYREIQETSCRSSIGRNETEISIELRSHSQAVGAVP